MKKLITYGALCTIAAILFSSCMSNLSITKRHYTGGYYVDYSKGTQAGTITAAREEKTSQPKVSIPSTPEQVPATNTITVEPIKTTANVIQQSNKRMQAKIRVQKSAMNESNQKTNALESVIIPNKPVLDEAPASVSDDSGARALSLLWLVIVIILILWLIGILAGGFGLGGLINLLLLIALILLILWLLRVV